MGTESLTNGMVLPKDKAPQARRISLFDGIETNQSLLHITAGATEYQWKNSAR
jgi:hypothetical protein